MDRITNMPKYTVDVACFFCFTPNRVQVGVDFYETRAFYTCHSCKKAVSLHISQTNLIPLPTDMTNKHEEKHLIPKIQSNSIQIGEPIDA